MRKKAVTQNLKDNRKTIGADFFVRDEDEDGYLRDNEDRQEVSQRNEVGSGFIDLSTGKDDGVERRHRRGSEVSSDTIDFIVERGLFDQGRRLDNES